MRAWAAGERQAKKRHRRTEGMLRERRTSWRRRRTDVELNRTYFSSQIFDGGMAVKTRLIAVELEPSGNWASTPIPLTPPQPQPHLALVQLFFDRRAALHGEASRSQHRHEHPHGPSSGLKRENRQREACARAEGGEVRKFRGYDKNIVTPTRRPS